MRRRIAFLLVTLGLVTACGGGATPTPTEVPTPAPTDVAPPPAPSAAPSGVPAATELPATGRRYKVKSGDTLWALAERFGVSLTALREANPDVEPTKMQVGTILVIPDE